MKTKTEPGTPATKTVSTPTAVENNNAQQLADLETAFEKSYKETAALWAQIRVQKLYAPAFGSFAEYCSKRWRTATKVLWKSVFAEATKGAEKPAKAPKVAAPASSEPSPNHLPKGKTLVEALGLAPAPAPVPAKPAKKTAQPKHSHEPGGPGGAAEQVARKKQSLGQLKNRARMAKGETRAKLIAQIAREHGAAAAADLVPGEATEVPGVNNLPAVGVVA
jgi:hypothetical protein